MSKLNRWLISAVLALFALPAFGQELTFTAQTAVGDVEVTPALSWSTTPAAASCLASGAWTGAKAASGSESLPPITASATYNLECSWPGDAQRATLRWTPPTTNADGSAYTDPRGFVIRYGQASLTNTLQVDIPTATSAVVEPLTPGTWQFTVAAANVRGIESTQAGPVTKTINASQAVTRSVGIVVNPRPGTPGSLTVE